MSNLQTSRRITASRELYSIQRSVPRTDLPADHLDKNSDAALIAYLCLGWVPAPLHPLLGRQRDWYLPNPAPIPSVPSVETVRNLLTDAVKARIPNVGTVAIALSGGLDSGIMAAILRQHLPRERIFAVTLDFGPPWSQEVALARHIAKELDIPFFVIDASPASIASGVWHATQAMDSPYGDGVCVPWYLIAYNASRLGADTLFSGEGGDQVFGGWANKPMIAELALSPTSFIASYTATFHRFSDDLGQILVPPLADDHPLIFNVQQLIQDALPDNSPSILGTLRLLNLRLKGGQNIAPRYFEICEACIHSAHAPFFDDTVIRTVCGMPDQNILSGAVDKALLRDVARTYLTDETCCLPKRGMGTPVTDWCLGDHALGKTVRSVLSQKNKSRDRRLNGDTILRILEGKMDAPDGYRGRRVGERLWTLFQWEVYREVHSLPK